MSRKAHDGQVRLSLMEMGVWSKPVQIQFGEAYEEVLIQTIGDRTGALEYGHEAMQRKLLEYRADGDRFAALTEALRLTPTEDITTFVVEGEKPALAERLEREIPDPVEPRRDLAAGESEDGFAARHQEWKSQCRQLEARREQELQERVRRRLEELCALPEDELVGLARARRIDIECWNAFHQASDDWVLFEATRRAEEPSRPYFSTVEEVGRLHPEVKAQLAAAYRDLETPAEALAKAGKPEDELPKG
ncbi:MAG: hypothetical protein GTO55_11315 [Armatimonadetes bacterium]|nr:hypothetical protein [Armatimonadota bacterium]NIM24805.1 hypothetical protein [Armatimonadota bacterium]NIM68696.1 hypothetical protein [Armatimonadota bacterium]NIM76991.1 hypothetical protein [Armatimonadota bacterium]NIN06897.1 hypothetical protein [Armatimonadota bacterium]